MRKQAGFTLVEVLIAVLVLSVGLLGLAALQTIGTRVNHSAHLRSVATQLGYDMFDRMRANQDGFQKGFYNLPSASSSGCFSGTACTSEQVAKEDVFEWNAYLDDQLPEGEGVVCVDSTPEDGADASSPSCDGSGSSYAVKIWWVDEFDSGSGDVVTKRFVISGAP